MPSDLDYLQGTWQISGLELDGARVQPAGFAGARIVVSDDRFESHTMGAIYRGRIELNARKRPKTIDLVFTEGPEAGNVNPGIYQLDGDRWKLCLATRGGPRPATFATAPGSGHALELLSRAVEEAADEEPETRDGSGESWPVDPELEGEWAMISGTMNGLAMPVESLEDMRRVARNGEVNVLHGNHSMMRARYRTDRSTTPNSIDYEVRTGPNKGKLQYGVFELRDEVLKTTFAAPGQMRPSNFDGGPGRTATVWRKISG